MTRQQLFWTFLLRHGAARTQGQFAGLMLILALTLPGIALGQSPTDGNFYVAPDGHDTNSGTSWASPLLTLTQAQTDCAQATGSCVIHLAPAGTTLTTEFVLTRAETTIACEPGAVITTAVAVGGGVPFVIKANDTRITGCTFNFSSGVAAALSLANTVARATIDHNTFENYPGGGANNTLFVGDRSNTTLATAVTDVSVTDNVFLNNVGSNVNIQDYVTRAVISRNRFVTGLGTNKMDNQVINAQTTDSGTTIQGLTVSENVMFNGLDGDCIQIEQLSAGNPILDVTVSSNVCTLQAGADENGTGYSMAGIIGLSEVGNIFDANDVQLNIGNAPFEFVNVQNGTESGNSAVLGTQSTASRINIYTVIGNSTGIANGFSLNNSFTGNTASISKTSGAVAVCWGVGFGGGTSNSISRNTFTGNSCDFTGSTAPTAGFWMQANAVGTTVNNNLVSENNFIGTNVTGDGGICLEPDQGTMLHNVVGPNNVFNFHLQYCHNLGAQAALLLGSTLDNLTYGSTLSGPNHN